MTLLRRAPREVYRVYEEEDFLAGAGAEDGQAVRHEPQLSCDESQLIRDESPPRRHRPVLSRTGSWRRVLAATVIGAVVGLIAVTGLRWLMQSGAPRARSLPPRSARLIARGVVSSRAQAVADRPSGSGRYAQRANARGRGRVTPGGAGGRTLPGRRRQDRVVAAVLPAGGMSASSDLPNVEQAEFGFEQ
jgi:hypothetical protein